MLTATDTYVIALIGAYVAPPIISFLKREHWSTQIKQFVALVVSCAITFAAIAIVNYHAFSGLTVLQIFGLVFTGSQAVYNLFGFKETSLETFLSGIGSKKNVLVIPSTQIPHNVNIGGNSEVKTYTTDPTTGGVVEVAGDGGKLP